MLRETLEPLPAAPRCRCSYMLNGNGELPAYPVRVACSHLAESGLEGEELLASLARAVGVSEGRGGGLAALPPISWLHGSG